MKWAKNKQGFTIVELLIVIVVIAILTAITIVAYNGITRQAAESTLMSDLRNGAKQLSVKNTLTGTYPESAEDIPKSERTMFAYSRTADGYCLAASSDRLPGTSFRITQTGTIEEGECAPGAPLTMQAFTASQCAALATYTGSNDQALLTLQDSRNNQTYRIAKLADGHCWMLDNLQLGSTTGTTLMTPADSDVAANFTLPQAATSGTPNYDTPMLFAPVPGDTGAGATRYGYLYNWSAATAGETRASRPQGSGNAPHSICPAGWRLPTGSTTGEFALLNAKMNNASAASPSTATGAGYRENWQNSGPFKGTYAGTWYNAFNGQGSGAYVWSSTTYATHDVYAYSLTFSPTAVSPGVGGHHRSYAFSVRCLLR